MKCETLLAVKKLSRRINREVSRLKRMEDIILKTNAELDGLPHSNNHASIVEKVAVAAVDLKQKITELIEVRATCRIELTQWLERLIGNFYVECQTLIYRYAFEFEFCSIARRLGYSVSSVYRFHASGLSMLGLSASEIHHLELES